MPAGKFSLAFLLVHILLCGERCSRLFSYFLEINRNQIVDVSSIWHVFWGEKCTYVPGKLFPRRHVCRGCPTHGIFAVAQALWEKRLAELLFVDPWQGCQKRMMSPLLKVPADSRQRLQRIGPVHRFPYRVPGGYLFQSDLVRSDSCEWTGQAIPAGRHVPRADQKSVVRYLYQSKS